MLYCKSIKDFNKKLGTQGSLLGIDYGSKKIGISISDVNRVFSSPYRIIKTKEIPAAADIIKTIVEEKKISGVVIGYPLDLNGMPGETCKMVEKFAGKLGKKGVELPYFLQDERFSTRSALVFLESHVTSKKNKKEDDDSLAASYILQTAIDLMKNSL